MTPRETLRIVLRREGMPVIPFDIELTPLQYDVFMEQTGSTDVAQWFQLSHRNVRAALEPTADGRTHYPEGLPEGTNIDPWGVAHSPGSTAAMHMTRLHHPMSGEVALSQIVDYPMPQIVGSDELEAEVARIHQAGFAAMGMMSQTIWETAWAIRSMEDLMVDMLSQDERATALLDRVTEVSQQRASTYARAGCDIIHLGDDIGMQSAPMMSVQMWKDWLKPRLARVIESVRKESAEAFIFYHSCGFVEPFIDDLLEIGVQVLNPIQPESMCFERLHRVYGDRLSFWGTIGTQTTMPFGTPTEVCAAVHNNVALCKDNGGLVIAPTHVLEPEVPWENIIALRDACNTALG